LSTLVGLFFLGLKPLFSSFSKINIADNISIFPHKGDNYNSSAKHPKWPSHLLKGHRRNYNT
jgi:hypothetical protein